MFSIAPKPRTCSKTGGKFGLSKLLDRAFRNSPTGRKLEKVHADTSAVQPTGLTHLDEPFDGLDVRYAQLCYKRHLCLYIIPFAMIMGLLNRFDENARTSSRMCLHGKKRSGKTVQIEES